MKANELTNGNYVKFLGKVRKIKSIVWKDTGAEISFEGKNPVVVSLDEIEPIPITPEILEKNGFQCNSNTKTFYRILFNEPNLVVEVRLWDKDTNVRIGKQCDGTFRVGYDWYINGMEIHFVHELQHALRLCGIDKEITI